MFFPQSDSPLLLPFSPSIPSISPIRSSHHPHRRPNLRLEIIIGGCGCGSSGTLHRARGGGRAAMEAEGAAAAARNAKESLELAFQMSEILGAGLDRHTLSLLIALCDRGLNPEALATIVRELSSSASASASAAAGKSALPHP